MNRPLLSVPSAGTSRHLRTLAANYRLIGRPDRVGRLPMARLLSGPEVFWNPHLVDSLKSPLTRRRE